MACALNTWRQRHAPASSPPVYNVEKTGPDHLPTYRANVSLCGRLAYGAESPTIKLAKHDAASAWLSTYETINNQPISPPPGQDLNQHIVYYDTCYSAALNLPPDRDARSQWTVHVLVFPPLIAQPYPTHIKIHGYPGSDIGARLRTVDYNKELTSSKPVHVDYDNTDPELSRLAFVRHMAMSIRDSPRHTFTLVGDCFHYIKFRDAMTQYWPDVNFTLITSNYI